jgi:hypothetical protein
MRPVITLTTDFGLSDEYVGLMKGVIVGLAPEVCLIDITHNIPPQDIAQAARIIQHSYPFFPRRTIHLVVVDPGVGGERDILCLEADGHLFIGPDNGVFTGPLDDGLVSRCFRVINNELFHAPVSPTFHGRDIMAPLAGQLANGLDIGHVGPLRDPAGCRRLQLPRARIEQDQIIGEVVHVDHFGNLQTSITPDDLNAAGVRKALEVIINDRNHTAELASSYCDARTGELVVVINSRDHLEISISSGSAADHFGCSTGSPITVRRPPGSKRHA